MAWSLHNPANLEKKRRKHENVVSGGRTNRRTLGKQRSGAAPPDGGLRKKIAARVSGMELRHACHVFCRCSTGFPISSAPNVGRAPDRAKIGQNAEFGLIVRIRPMFDLRKLRSFD